MPNILKVLRSTTAAARPTGRAFGEIYWNNEDKTFGVVDDTGSPVDLAIALPPADDKLYAITRSSTPASDPAMYKEVSPLLAYDTLTLYVSPTGTPVPPNPDTTPSDTFDSLSSALAWVSDHVASARVLRINFEAGTYDDPATFLSAPLVSSLELIGAGSTVTTLNIPGQFISNALVSNVTAMTVDFDGSNGVGSSFVANGNVTLSNDTVMSRQGSGSLIGATGGITVANSAVVDISGESAGGRRLLEAVNGITLIGACEVTIANASTNNGIADLVNTKFQIGTASTLTVTGGSGEVNLIGATSYIESGPSGSPTLNNVVFNYDDAAVEEPPADGNSYQRQRAQGSVAQGQWVPAAGGVFRVVNTPPQAGDGLVDDVWVVVP